VGLLWEGDLDAKSVPTFVWTMSTSAGEGYIQDSDRGTS